MACFSSIWKTKSEVERNTLFFGSIYRKEADLKIDQLLFYKIKLSLIQLLFHVS